MADTNWISEDLLRSILQEEHGSKNQTIANIIFTVEPPTDKGDNYASELYRVAMGYDHNGQRVNCKRIFKVLPSGDQRRVEMLKTFMFPLEVAVYNTIMPKINGLLKSIGDSTVISPKFICKRDQPKTFLVFEDLKDAGFQIADRKLRLDLEHSRLVISKIAKLHACSVVAIQNNSTIVKKVSDGIISAKPERKEFLACNKMCFGQIAQLIESRKDPECDALLAYLKKLQTKFISKPAHVFNVLNHGDVWTSNAMFRYENGSAQDVVLLDFQLAYYGSPAVDLNYFLVGSVQEDVQEYSSMKLIRLYHDILKETLKKLGYEGKIPSVQDIGEETILRAFHRLNALFCQQMERTDGSEMARFLDDSADGETFQDEGFANSQLKAMLERTLTDFCNTTFFDVGKTDR